MATVAETKTANVKLESFEHIHQVPLTLSAELDQRKISVGDLLELHVGSVLTLSRPAGENIDLYAADVLLGSGEVLVIDGKMAVRLAELRDKPPDPPLEQPLAAEA